MPRPSPPVHSIAVIVGRDLVGDGLIKLPFLQALKDAFPNAATDWLTSEGPSAYGSILQNLTGHLLRRVIDRPDFLAIQKKSNIPAKDMPFYDLIIDTRGHRREAWQAKKIPHNLFISPSARFLLSDRRPAFYKKRPRHILDRLLQLIELAAGRIIETKRTALSIDSERRTKALHLLPQGKIYVGLAPGAGARRKIWPLQHFIEIAKEQLAKGRQPVFLLGPAEMEWHALLRAELPLALFPLQETSAQIEDTLAIGERLDLAVTNDSGTSHMLAAVDCPLVLLFGPTDPAKLAPRVSYARILQAPHNSNGADMRKINPKTVADAVDALLQDLKSKRTSAF